MENMSVEDFSGAEASEGVKETDPGKAQEDAKGARQTRQQIKKHQQQNFMYAELLKIILKVVVDNIFLQKIISLISDYHLHIDKIFLYMLPYLKENIKDENILILYKEYINIDCPKVTDYSRYCKMLIDNQEESFDVDKVFFLEFVIDLLCFFKVSGLTKDMMTPEDQEKLKVSLKKAIF